MIGLRFIVGLFLVLGILLPSTGYTKPLVADLSRHVIEIDSSFTGTDLLLFGTRNATGDVVVVIRGPERGFVLRKKERVAGIWINRKEQSFKRLPQYYAVASTRPLETLEQEWLLRQQEIGLEYLPFTHGAETAPGEDAQEFIEALLRERERSHLYNYNIREISFMGESLFKTVIHFPDNIPRGTYSAEVYLINDGRIMGMQSTPLVVRKEGFDAFVFDLAHRHSLIYGLLAVIIALIAGWGAGAIFRKV